MGHLLATKVIGTPITNTISSNATPGEIPIMLAIMPRSANCSNQIEPLGVETGQSPPSGTGPLCQSRTRKGPLGFSKGATEKYNAAKLNNAGGARMGPDNAIPRYLSVCTARQRFTPNLLASAERQPTSGLCRAAPGTPQDDGLSFPRAGAVSFGACAGVRIDGLVLFEWYCNFG